MSKKKVRIKLAKKLLKMFLKYNERQFANVVTDDETWIYYFEPVRKVGNKIWSFVEDYTGGNSAVIEYDALNQINEHHKNSLVGISMRQKWVKL